MSDFGVRKCLLIKKAPTEKMETQIVVPKLHFEKVQGEFFMLREGDMGGARSDRPR